MALLLGTSLRVVTSSISPGSLATWHFAASAGSICRRALDLAGSTGWISLALTADRRRVCFRFNGLQLKRIMDHNLSVLFRFLDMRNTLQRKYHVKTLTTD
jgi:hypothetical protein